MSENNSLETCPKNGVHLYPPIVLGHRDLPNVKKACPGFSVTNWLGNDMQPLPAHVLGNEEIADDE